MVSVLVYVDELTSTSIPVEMAAKAHGQDGIEVTLVSHFDSTSDQINPDVEEMDVPQIRLGASSRIDLEAIKELRHICVENDIDILHTHPIAIGSVGHVLLYDVVDHIVTTEHSDHRFRGIKRRFSKSITYPLVDTIVSNSQSTKQSMNWLEKLFSATTQRTTIYNGINTDFIDAAKKEYAGINNFRRPLIVTVGRSVKAKNQNILLRSFKLVHNDNPEAILVLVGDGPLLDSHKELASELGIRDSIIFTGCLRREDVYSVLKQSTLAVFTSQHEGFCVAAVEAMASGLPVVASDIDVFHEVIDEGGLYASPDNPEEFAEKITTLLKTPQMRSDIGDIAAQRARSKFPLEHTGQEYAQLYKKIADEQS